ncbi:hypothetical protein ACEUZ9_003261 [Paracoccus litorisediminis]|uniref:aldose epimerase family protein n=1 Tax=Paracoccus litorisediminis TaxID=2006130 RepID=UPI003734241C
MEDTGIESGELRMVLRPAWGGRVLSLTLGDRPILMPLQGAAGVFDPQIWPKGGAYPLLPFHNRIPQGRFTWNGREVNLPLHPQEPATVHGHGHQRVWQATAHDASSVVLELAEAGQGAWPWPFTATQRFTVTKRRVDVQLSITNRADEPAPAGLGWHPFFAKCRAIRSDAAREWPMGADLLPIGGWRAAASDGAATRYLSDWSRAELVLENGLAVTLTASAALSHLVIHDPAGAYSCVEPVSHLANSMNLHPERAVDNLVALAPGQTLGAQVTLQC